MKQLFFLLILLTTLLNCKKEVIVIPDNTPYQDKYISTIQVESYVNKLFIDLIGREPLNTEMDKEVSFLKEAKLNLESRKNLISKLQSDTSFIEGDTSYQKAYYHRFYDVLKIKMLEGVENDIMYSERGIYQNAYEAAVNSGDSALAARLLKDITEITNILSISEDYRLKKININEIFLRLIDNYVYDIINMNTFNFVNATFDDLFFRMPTLSEYDIAYEMVENNQSGFLLGKTGTNKGEYMDLLINSREFHEGIITWTYKNLLVREPQGFEIAEKLEDFVNTKNVQKLQLDIMKTDEYADF